MNRFKKLGLLAVVLAGTISGSVAFAQSHLTTPLMVIRFNESRVYYQQPLYNAVSKALEAKADVMFTLVSVTPQTGNQRMDANFNSQTSQHTGAVLKDLQEMGLPQNRVRVQHQASPAVSAPEVHLFVE